MIVTYIGPTQECSPLVTGKEYEIVAIDIQVFKPVYKLKDIEGWHDGKHFQRNFTSEEDPEPFSEF